MQFVSFCSASSPGDVHDASGKRENGAPPQETNTLGPFPPGANQFDPNIHNMIGIKKVMLLSDMFSYFCVYTVCGILDSWYAILLGP